MRESLTKKERLTNVRRIKNLFSFGKQLACDRVVILYKKNEGGKKILFSASKQYNKNKVKRNRAKRLLREVYRKHKDSFPNNYDFALIALPLREESFEKRKKNIVHALNTGYNNFT